MTNLEKQTEEKINLHIRNQHRFGYNFELLIDKSPDLKQFVFVNKYHKISIDFSNAQAVRALNRALLISYYHIKTWNLPEKYLCPPIPGRVDYIHNVADLLAADNNNIIPTGVNIRGLDIGIGANCIYPILGNAIYNWSFTGSDIDKLALDNCNQMMLENTHLSGKIVLKMQSEPRFAFKNIVTPDDLFAFSICNPPFHNSIQAAKMASARKVKNLHGQKTNDPTLNFGGQKQELCCEGGEKAFVNQMVFESARFSNNVIWFTCLVSKRENLESINKTLKKVGVIAQKTIEMAQGQKTSRMVAWTFMKDEERQVKFEALCKK